MLLPPPWRELGHARGRVFADKLKYVDQVGVRVDVLQSAGRDQALHDAGVLGADFCPTEEPERRRLTAYERQVTSSFKMTRPIRSKLSAMRPALPWFFSCSRALTRSTVE